MIGFRSRLFFGVVLALVARPSAQAGFTGTDVFIPAVARASGAGGSQFYSTLWVTNLGSAAANLQLDFLRQGQANPTPVIRTDTLGAGATRRYDNVVEQLFGVSGVGGAVRVRANQEVFVSSRTYDRPTGAELKDVKGLFFSGIPASLAIGSGEVSRLQGVSNGPLESYRYNFGLVETTGQPVTVTVRLRNEDGGVTHTQLYDLGAYEARQVNAFAGFTPDVSVTNALLEAQVGARSGEGPLLRHADRGHGDEPGLERFGGLRDELPEPAGGRRRAERERHHERGHDHGRRRDDGDDERRDDHGGVLGRIGGRADAAVCGHGRHERDRFRDHELFDAAWAFRPMPSARRRSTASSTNSRGVFGEGGAYGVYGSSSNEGVHGQGAIGVYGLAQSPTGKRCLRRARVRERRWKRVLWGWRPWRQCVLPPAFWAPATRERCTSAHTSTELRRLWPGEWFQRRRRLRLRRGCGHRPWLGPRSMDTWRRWLLVGSSGVRGRSQTGEGVSGEALGVNTGAGVLGANDAGGIGIGVYGRAKANGNRAGYFDGGITVVNGAKSFVEPHPTDPTKQIRFAALEGPESGTYFRGTGRTVNGYATIEVPGSVPHGHRRERA